ncbi:exonuclease SbcCD subunit D [Cryobacterium psychrophilum]|uniref:Nuclease SbcCD subunit D n=1 Tax=Cryobacterium psychrophilum TaxID=41988 RepID=A0A4Y8KNW6_9MICO|nr:exonuclease SbcCD subunit D C-terminal domain-containing protein [Cryobacterium psychrophilum]TDW29304.1 exodeoxyribonuclease I subunit D [Cryobacterium psychrophilum]TFD79980.1 exonuclease subunit SbcD [Cryobacterium psychrophilum]
MKILHTSDWHIGRTFHTHSTLDNLNTVLSALVAVVRDRGVDVVAVAGDIFDNAMPSKESYAVLTRVLRDIKDAGAAVVMTSGNHDSAARLGFQAEWASLAGIHVVTRHDEYLAPVTIHDDDGPVHFYGIPYLEPALIRHFYPDVELKTHEQALRFAMDRIRLDLQARGGRSVVLSHCFVAGVAAAAEASTVERDITVGGLDVVPLEVFDGPDYVALGHIHGRARLSDRVRYSGAPLHYSFAEAGKPRGAWLVELLASAVDAAGDGNQLAVEWVHLPVPRRLTVLEGTLQDLLTDERYAEREQDWVKAILTDQVRPLDSMRSLQERFPHCITLEHRPARTVTPENATYAERLRAARTDPEIVAGFLSFVRNGEGPTGFETALISELFAEQGAREANS